METHQQVEVWDFILGGWMHVADVEDDSINPRELVREAKRDLIAQGLSQYEVDERQYRLVTITREPLTETS